MVTKYMDIKDFKNDFDTIFLEELQGLIDEASSTLGSHTTEIYIKYINDLAKHGKRIRPYNAALIYTMYSGKNWVDIKNVLFGLEIIHLMALVHDDVMDNSDKRHGSMSMHNYIKDDLLKKSIEVDPTHVSNSLAILVGDLLFAWAYREFNKQNPSQESWSVINKLVEEVILGQALDVYNPIESETTQEAIIKKMLLKTARYTFTRPLQLGLTCANIKIEDAVWIKDFGDSLGILFQIQDDVFDITEDFETIKKEPLSDIKNGIHTVVSTYVMENENKDNKELWLSWFGNKRINNQEEIKEFLRKNGALSFANKYITEEREKAEKAIEMSGLGEDKRNLMRNLLAMIMKRTH